MNTKFLGGTKISVKIYVMCRPPKLSKLEMMYNIYSRAVIIGSKPMLYNLLNTLVPAAPAVLDSMSGIIKQSRNITMIVTRIL